MFDGDAEFEYETQLQIRIRDLDHMEHINNAVYATYMEQARVDYLDDYSASISMTSRWPS